jgi:hypothetical protein
MGTLNQASSENFINMIEYFGQVSLHIYMVLLDKAMLIIWPGVNEWLYIEDRLGIL